MKTPTPYGKRPPSEDEALNLIADSRKDEPTPSLGRYLMKAK